MKEYLIELPGALSLASEPVTFLRKHAPGAPLFPLPARALMD
jgi:hypothetical protein